MATANYGERKSARVTNFDNEMTVQFMRGEFSRKDQCNRYKLKKMASKYRKPATTIITIKSNY